MQKAPDWKGTGLVPIKPVTAKNESGEEKIHVFGKNLEDRVKTEDDNEGNNSTPLLFQFGSSQDTSETSQKIQDEDIETIKKRKFEAITGEEDETTVFQGDFKLFCWDIKTSNWIERGRGQLKLNDCVQDEKRRSRLIMRLGGTYRIILNVSINHSHFKVITNSKSNIRFTDGQNLWAASGQNAQHLKELIEKRIDIPTKNQDTQIPVKTIQDKIDPTPDTKKAKVLSKDEPNDDVAQKEEKVDSKNSEDNQKVDKDAITKTDHEKTKDEPSDEKIVPVNQDDAKLVGSHVDDADRVEKNKPDVADKPDQHEEVTDEKNDPEVDEQKDLNDMSKLQEVNSQTSDEDKPAAEGDSQN